MGTHLDLSGALPGMSITTQYQNLGVVITPGRNIRAETSLPPYGGNVIVVSSGVLHAPGRGRGRGGGIINPPLENPSRTIHAEFTKPLRQLMLFVSDNAMVEVFDGEGKSVGKDETSIEGAEWRQVRLTSVAEKKIYSFTSRSLFVGHEVGRIIMYEALPPDPDFALLYTGGTVKLKAGIPSQVSIKIVRVNDSIGGILINGATPDPNLVEVIGVSPQEYFGEKAEVVMVSIVAKREDVQPGVTRRPITISAVATGRNGLAGRLLKTVDIPWTILESVNARMVGMEITQGIQLYQVPEADDGSGNIRYTQPYWGLSLVRNRKTMVRIFCSVPRKPKYPLEDYLIKLHGWQVQHHDSVVFPASPLQRFAISGRAIETTTYPLAERWRYAAAVEFILPPEWTRYSAGVTLQAELKTFKPSLTYDPDILNNIFTVTDIAFIERVNLSIQPYQLRILDSNGNDVNRPIRPLNDIFNDMIIMHPIGDNQLDVLPWAGYIDITAVYNKGEDWSKTGLKIVSNFRKALKKSGRSVTKYIPVGIFPAWVNSPTDRIRQWGETNDPDEIKVVIAQDEFRPWTGVAHEIGHYLGRRHASAANGAEGADSWPPDQLGLIQGVGWDFRSGGGYRFTEEPSPGIYLHAWYDYMSYHADRESWMSVRGWGYMTSRLAPSWRARALVAGGGDAEESRRAPVMHAIVVSAVRYADGEWEIVDIDLVKDQMQIVADKDSDSLSKNYQILVLDSTSSILHHATPKVSLDNDQPADAHYQILQLDATFEIKDPSQVHQIHITENENVVVKKTRPQTAPDIKDLKISSPSNDDDHDNWTINFLATHKQAGLQLFATITYLLADSTWSLVYAGEVALTSSPTPTTIKFPATCFPRNKNGRIRLSVSDGFNTTTITSSSTSPINAPGFPPTISIQSPASPEDAKLTTGEYVYLHATTRDDRLQSIDDADVRWYLEEDFVASGALTGFVLGTDTVVGRKRLRVEGTDYAGRKVEAGVEVEVEAGSVSVLGDDDE